MQKRMLDGEMGEPVRQGMELIVELGKFWDASDLVPVRSVHMAGASVKTARRAGRKHIRWIADEGGKFVVSATLMSLGMMMLPPSLVSLPFKLLLFVLVNGWALVAQSLITSFH